MAAITPQSSGSYSREIFDDSRQWIKERGIFEDGDLGANAFEKAVVTLAH